MPRFAANISMLFTEVPFEARFDAARQAGFDGVECWFPYEWPVAQVARWQRAAGLPVALINAPAGDWQAGERGLLGLVGRERECRDGFERALEYAASLGCQQINCLAGVAPAGVARSDWFACARDNLACLSERAAGHGIRCLVEAINTRDVPGYLLPSTDDVVALLDAVDCANTGLQYDIYHMQIMEGDITQRVRYLLERIAHIQFADNPGRHEPGTGELNFEYIFGALDAMGYAGWVSAEYVPALSTPASLDWLKQARAARPTG